MNNTKLKDCFTLECVTILYQLLSDYDNRFFTYNDISITESELYINIIGNSGDRIISPVYSTILNTDTISDKNTFTANMIFHKFIKRWDSILSSLLVNYSAFDTSKKVSSNTIISNANTKTNFDLFANENLNTQIKQNERENVVKNDNTLTNSTTVTSYDNLDFNKAIEDYIKSTSFNIIDVIIEDIVKFLTIDIM